MEVCYPTICQVDMFAKLYLVIESDMEKTTPDPIRAHIK